MSVDATHEDAQPAGGQGEALIEVRDLVKEFPIKGSYLTRRRAARRGPRRRRRLASTSSAARRFGIVGESGCGKSTTARLLMRLLGPTSGSVRFEGQEIADLQRKEIKPLRREMQMIFQDPYSSLNPRRTVGTIIARPVRDPQDQRGQGRAQARGPGADGHRRAQPGALQPLPARVLRRAAPAHRRGARARAQAEADRRRRAGLGARRLDPGADTQPAARPPARARADADLHRPRPLGRPPHVRPRRRDVPRQDRRAGQLRPALPPSADAVHGRADVGGAGRRPGARGDARSARSSPATCRRRRTRRRPAGSTRAAGRRRRSAAPRSRRSSPRRAATSPPATSR